MSPRARKDDLVRPLVLSGLCVALGACSAVLDFDFETRAERRDAGIGGRAEAGVQDAAPLDAPVDVDDKPVDQALSDRTVLVDGP